MLCFATACGRSSEQKNNPDSSGAAASSVSTVAATASTDSGEAQGSSCPGTGKWAVCSVEKRLKQAGFVLRKSAESPARSGFSVRPQVYTLGHSRLELFLYPDAAALGSEVSKIDTVRAAPPGGSNGWEVPPTFVRSENLAAVFVTDNPQQAERLTLALTAGPPQPASVQKLKPSISRPSSPR